MIPISNKMENFYFISPSPILCVESVSSPMGASGLRAALLLLAVVLGALLLAIVPGCSAAAAGEGAVDWYVCCPLSLFSIYTHIHTLIYIHSYVYAHITLLLTHFLFSVRSVSLGFSETLMCSTCDLLELSMSDSSLTEECNSCCMEDKQDAEAKFISGTFEVCK